MLDLDHFKDVNDTYGHAVGDQVLQEFTQLVQAELRQGDTLARWGGEEFTIAVPGTTLEAAIRLAERLRRAVETHEFPMVGNLTVSLGIAEYQAGDSALTLLERADVGLYQAKAGGRNRAAVQATG